MPGAGRLGARLPVRSRGRAAGGVCGGGGREERRSAGGNGSRGRPRVLRSIGRYVGISSGITAWGWGATAQERSPVGCRIRKEVLFFLLATAGKNRREIPHLSLEPSPTARGIVQRCWRSVAFQKTSSGLCLVGKARKQHLRRFLLLATPTAPINFFTVNQN